MKGDNKDLKKCPKCGGPVEKDCWGIWCPNGKCKWPGTK